MKHALLGATALALAAGLSGCAGLQGAIGAAAPAIATIGCDLLDPVASTQTVCANAAGDLISYGDSLAAKASAAKAQTPSAASKATALAVSAPPPQAAAHHK